MPVEVRWRQRIFLPKLSARPISYPTPKLGIVHAAVFPAVFKSHNMDLVGSRYKSDDVPRLYLYGGTPKLDAFWGDGADPKWGAPSCGSVIVL